MTSIISANLNSFHNLLQKFGCYTPPFAKKIKLLSNQSEVSLSSERKNLILEALQPKHFNATSSSLHKICKKLEPSDLHLLIHSTLNDIVPTATVPQDSLILFNNLKKLLTLDQIEQAIRSERPNFKSTLDTAKEMLSCAKYYLDITHPAAIKPLLNRTLHNLIWSIEAGIDFVLSIFGFDLLQRDKESFMETPYRLEAILTITSAVSTCVAIATALAGSAVLGATLAGAGIILGSIALGIYFKYIKPAPRSVKGFQNLTLQAETGKIPTPSKGIQNYIDEIARTFISGMDAKPGIPKIHPLLIGPSGAGKTEIVKGFAHAVAEGRYPELKGKQIFYINTADLTNTSQFASLFDSPPTLDKMKERIKYRREDVIIVLDEIHQAVHGSKNGNLAERLKTLLDNGEEGFPFVLGATTNDEYEKYILHNCQNENLESPLARRFSAIVVDMMNKDLTIVILNKMIINQSGIHTSPEVIESIYEKTKKLFPDSPQPYMSCRILAQAIAAINTDKTSDLRAKISDLECILEKNISSQLIRPGLGLLDQDEARLKLHAENKINTTKLENLKIELRQNAEYANTLKLILNKIEATKTQLCKLAAQLEDHEKMPSKKIEPLLKEFALTSYYVNWAWDNAFKMHSAKNPLSSVQIDQTLIDRIVEREVNLKVKKEAVLFNTPARPKSSKTPAPLPKNTPVIEDEEESTFRARGQKTMMNRPRRKLVF